MKSTPKWLLIPPAVAGLLILASLSMQNGAPPKSAAVLPVTEPEAQPPAAAPKASTNPFGAGTMPGALSGPSSDALASRRDPVLPRAPDLWSMASALAGVLLLGAGGVYALRRLRGPVRTRNGSTLITLRQTLRLSAKQAVHAIEFDDRILLIGEHDRGLALLDSGKLPERAADEAEIAARSLAAIADAERHDEGAVPKDLVIPRPPAATVAAAAHRRPTVGLADFRNLLQKAARS